jgi:DNA-binding transcriptional ArsR family regulator
VFFSASALAFAIGPFAELAADVGTGRDAPLSRFAGITLADNGGRASDVDRRARRAASDATNLKAKTAALRGGHKVSALGALHGMTFTSWLYNLLVMDRDNSVSRIFAALADPTRRAILERLAAGEAGVVELSETSALTQPAITKHLKVLEHAGLIARARDGQRRPARLQIEGLTPVDEWLRLAHAAWSDRLDRLETHLATKTETED